VCVQISTLYKESIVTYARELAHLQRALQQATTRGLKLLVFHLGKRVAHLGFLMMLLALRLWGTLLEAHTLQVLLLVVHSASLHLPAQMSILSKGRVAIYTMENIRTRRALQLATTFGIH